MSTATDIRPGALADLAGMEALLPELAAFEVPAGRNPDDLWLSDRDTLRRWAQGREPACLVHVASDGARLLGFTLVRLRQELLSGAPSAHLEAIVVHEDARGMGLGGRLLANAEAQARQAGAESMTLHVFGNNTRARAVYRKAGYDEELIRAHKRL